MTTTPDFFGIRLSCGQATHAARGFLELARADAEAELLAAAAQPKFRDHWKRVSTGLSIAIGQLDQLDKMRRAPADRSGDIMGEIFPNVARR